MLCVCVCVCVHGRLAPNVHVVRGGFDDDTTFPDHKIIQIGQFKIGLMHGHQIVPWGDAHSLAMVQRQLDVDILITGHTHRNEVSEFEGKWFINPGSITGAYRCVINPVDLAIFDEMVQCYFITISNQLIVLCIYISTLTTDVVPSFILLAIQGNKVVTYVYELHGDQVDVSKSEFSKA